MIVEKMASAGFSVQLWRGPCVSLLSASSHKPVPVWFLPEKRRWRKFPASLFLLFILFSLLRTLSEAQQPASPPDSPSPTQGNPGTPKGEKSEEEKEIEKKEQSQRALGVLPVFGVTDRWNASPLTPGEKFHLFVKSAFDPATIGTVGLQAGFSQAVNEFPGYGQGMQGFGKRFGASLADEVSANFWSGYFYPVLLKEDPRFFRLGSGGFKRRMLNSVVQEFVCHTDQGKRSFSYSNVLGAFTSGGLSNLYYPGRTVVRTAPATATSPPTPVFEDDRGVVLTVSRSVIALGYDMAGNLFDEFWPDIHRKMKGKHGHDATAPH